MQELEKTREMLLIQHKINKDYEIEVRKASQVQINKGNIFINSFCLYSCLSSCQKLVNMFRNQIYLVGI